MEVTRLTWLGVRTSNSDEMVSLFRDVMGLAVISSEGGFTALKTIDGDTVEVFAANSPWNEHFGTAPVAGFAVTDFEAACAELRDAGLQIVHVNSDPATGYWAHVVGPDRNLYEITGLPATGTAR